MKFDLVFEGGGAKGMVFVGALQEFEKQGHTPGRLLGTSAGAIAATLLAADYTPQEMLAILSEEEEGQPIFAGFLGTPPAFSQEDIEKSNFREFLKNVDLPMVFDFVEERLDDWLAETLLTRERYRNFFSFVERGGWYSAHKFVDWFSRKLDSGLYRGQPRRFSAMSLAEFFDVTNIELSMVATDTSAERMLVINHRTAPRCPLVWAVRMSMSIPLLWPEVVWQADWGPYREREISGHLIVDGGLLSNFPIELFISDDPHVTAVMGPHQSTNVLGLLIDDALPVTAVGVAGLPERVKPLTETEMAHRFMRLINTTMRAHDKMVIDAFEQYIVRLPAGGYGVTEFDMNEARRKALVTAGQAAVQAYFEQDTVGTTMTTTETTSTPDPAGYANKIARKILGQ